MGFLIDPERRKEHCRVRLLVIPESFITIILCKSPLPRRTLWCELILCRRRLAGVRVYREGFRTWNYIRSSYDLPIYIIYVPAQSTPNRLGSKIDGTKKKRPYGQGL